MPQEPIYFADAEQLRDWFTEHAATERELMVGFTKTHTGRAGLTWPASVDEALCVGWIDGVRRRVDDERYSIRFTPRTATSNWSDVNIRRVPELEAQGRMTPAGRAAFKARQESRSRTASYEQGDTVTFNETELAIFQRESAAWAFFQSTPPGYRRTVTWLVINAKRDETRLRRLSLLIEACANGERMR